MAVLSFPYFEELKLSETWHLEFHQISWKKQFHTVLAVSSYPPTTHVSTLPNWAMGRRNFAQVLSSNLQGSDSGLAQAGERPWHSYETLHIMVLERDKALQFNTWYTLR